MASSYRAAAAMWPSGNAGYAAAAATAATTTLLIIAYRDYSAFVALGPSGLPNTFSGWYTQLKMRRRARSDTTVPAPYDLDEALKVAGPHASSSYLGERPTTRRAGSRPKIPNFAAPQRQLTAVASESVKAQMTGFLQSLVEANGSVLQMELSMLEGPVPAVQLKKGVDAPDWLKHTRREMIHVHPPDGSTHVLLSLADSKTLIAQGWAERHRLSGVMVPWGYTLVYAPRDQAEYKVWQGIVLAAARYCCSGVSEITSP